MLTLHLTCWFKQKCTPSHWNHSDCLKIRSEEGERPTIIRNKSTGRGAKPLGQVPHPSGTLWAGRSLTIAAGSQDPGRWPCLGRALVHSCGAPWCSGLTPICYFCGTGGVSKHRQVWERHGHDLKKVLLFTGLRTQTWYSREVAGTAWDDFLPSAGPELAWTHVEPPLNLDQKFILPHIGGCLGKLMWILFFH